MKEEEKANELIEKFKAQKVTVCDYNNEPGNPNIVTENMITHSAKQCALICVDEILTKISNELQGFSRFKMNPPPNIVEDLQYWQAVKKELNKK